MKLRTLAGCVLIAIVAGCAAPSEVLVRPSDGMTVRCSSVGGGIIGASAAILSKEGCVSDYKSIGYVTLEQYQTYKKINPDAKAGDGAKRITPTIESGGGNGAANGVNKPLENNLKPVQLSEPNVISEKDSGYSIALKEGWVTRALPENLKNRKGSLYVSNDKQSASFIITTEQSRDLVDFASYCAKRQEDIFRRMVDASKTKIEYLKINGNEAANFEVKGRLQSGMNVHYFYTIIKSEKIVLTVSAWSGESRFSELRSDFEKVGFDIQFID